jgi:hypothetical protein
LDVYKIIIPDRTAGDRYLGSGEALKAAYSATTYAYSLAMVVILLLRCTSISVSSSSFLGGL